MINFVNLKLLRKIITLAGLTALAAFVLAGDLLNQPIQAHSRMECNITAQFSASNACGSNYDTTVANYDNRTAECQTQAQSECNSVAPQDYASCVENKRTTCINTRTTAYDNRLGSMLDCDDSVYLLHFDPDACWPFEIDLCPAAIGAGYDCLARFPQTEIPFENDEGRAACLLAVPGGPAQGRYMGCPGFPLGY